MSDPNARMNNRLLYGVGPVPPPTEQRATGRLGRTSIFAVHAAEAALRDAGLDAAAAGADGAGFGVAVGTGVGDCSLFEQARADGLPPEGVDGFPFKVSAAIAGQLNLTGPSLSVSTACSASGYSVSLAAEAIQDGLAEVAVAGGADAYTRVGVACFNRMGALDPLRCRPFDAGRRGTIFGEGAAFLVLESESHARRRNHARSYGVIESAGWSCDAHHPTAPEPEAREVVRAMREALDRAEVSPGDVGCVVPHGTGTPLNDTVEGRALHELFGPAGGQPPVYSLKAMLGHTGGAAGAFSLLTAALILDRATVPPNIPVTASDSECGISLHSAGPVPPTGAHVLVNAYAFGGNNISVLIGRDR